VIISLRAAEKQPFHSRSKTTILEWLGDGIQWHRIHERNVKPSERNPEGFKVFREVMNRVYAGETVEVVAEYHLETGELFIIRLA